MFSHVLNGVTKNPLMRCGGPPERKPTKPCIWSWALETTYIYGPTRLARVLGLVQGGGLRPRLHCQ